jgi:hypothetical protein
MAKKAGTVLIWFQVTVILLLVNLTLLSTKNTSFFAKKPISSTNIILAPSIGSGKVLGTSIVTGDARGLLLHNFIARYQPNSPFLTLSDYLVFTADKYTLDYRLIPAIAMCESNLGTHIPSHDSFNAWGIAVYTGQQNGKKFNDWPAAIDWVGKFIKEKFYDKNITNLNDIGAIWDPPSVEKDYSWTKCVSSFMDEMH